jgi:hypothetical protein
VGVFFFWRKVEGGKRKEAGEKLKEERGRRKVDGGK